MNLVNKSKIDINLLQIIITTITIIIKLRPCVEWTLNPLRLRFAK